jgi:hypothetical protein
MVLIEEVSDSDLNEAAVVLAASPAASAEQTQQDDVNDEDGQRAEGTGTGATVEEMIEKERTEYEEARNDFYQKQVHFFGGSDGVRQGGKPEKAPTPNHRGLWRPMPAFRSTH